MSNRVSRWIVLELMRPVVLLGSVVERAHKLLFGPREVRRSREADHEFGLEIQQNLPFLFVEYAGTILMDESLEYPRPFDYTVAIVALTALSFRFIRGRGEFRVQVAPEQSLEAWEDLPLVLSLIATDFEAREFSSLQDAATALKPRMGRLIESFSADRRPALQQKLSSVHQQEQAVIRRWQTEIKRRLSEK